LPSPGPVGGTPKRVLDLAVALPLAVALTPVMAGIALLVRRDSPGPALFRQQRIGYAGRPFTLLKYGALASIGAIFSAVMIGFGRAVGETMIVLMATGNTPVMESSIFNGFRALSANIAVELPEAPEGGTLFRVLFLAALLLFLMTFVVNTAAELVRLRLRKKYRTFE
jgi:phosphate transport system permease protein